MLNRHFKQSEVQFETPQFVLLQKDAIVRTDDRITDSNHTIINNISVEQPITPGINQDINVFIKTKINTTQPIAKPTRVNSPQKKSEAKLSNLLISNEFVCQF